MSTPEIPDSVVIETPRGNVREADVVDRRFAPTPQTCPQEFVVEIDGYRFVVPEFETLSHP